MTVVTPIDRPKSVRNRCVIEVVGGVFVLSIVPHLGLANAPIVETKFLELVMSLLYFSPRIPLGTFSILFFEFSVSIWFFCQGTESDLFFFTS